MEDFYIIFQHFVHNYVSPLYLQCLLGQKKSSTEMLYNIADETVPQKASE